MKHTLPLTILVSALMLLIPACNSGNQPPTPPPNGDDQEPDTDKPATPTDLTAEIKDDFVEVSWNGITSDYKFQQSWKDETGEWKDQPWETLTNQSSLPSGKKFKRVADLPAQEQRFRVTALDINGNESDATDWESDTP